MEAPFDNGYGKSKFVAEALCDEASRYLHIPVSVARVGQIAGAVKCAGWWTPTEWLPSLITTSKHLRMLPDSLGATLSQVTWTPVDLAAEAVAELCIGQMQDNTSNAPSTGAVVYHLRNPQATTWKALLPRIKVSLDAFALQPIEVVPTSAWLAQVHLDLEQASSSQDEQTLAKLLAESPGTKLLDFFSHSLTETDRKNELDLTHTMAASPALRSIPSVSDEWVSKWISEWMTVQR